MTLDVAGRPAAANPARRSAPLRLGGAVLAATAVVVLVDPQHTHVPLCPFHAATGLQCPLCGSLRAVNALARGHLIAALRDNALFVAAVPVLVVLWLQWFVRPSAHRPSVHLPRWTSAAVLVLAAAFTIVRNMPFASALRP